MERWKGGMVEDWKDGRLERWKVGILKNGMLEKWNGVFQINKDRKLNFSLMQRKNINRGFTQKIKTLQKKLKKRME